MTGPFPDDRDGTAGDNPANEPLDQAALVASSSRILRVEHGVLAVNVRGQLIHPECRTADEVKLTVRFYKSVTIGNTCPRCKQSITRNPPVSGAT